MTLKTEREKYTGREASEYESRRKNAPPWQQEQDAVSLLVKNGPVLDVPIGTGRYLPIYQAKGLAYVGCDISADMIEQALRRDPALAFKEGDILNLPFADKAFATAVCTRLLNWLAPDEMQKAVRELHRVAHTVVLSIRVGEGAQRQKTYTHKAGDLLDALDGAWITDELLLRDEGPAGHYYMVRSKWPEWGHVQAQFAHQSASLQVLADEWAERYGLALRDITDRPVRCEYWTGEKIGREVDKMAILEPRLTREGSPHVAREPYTHDAPITVLDFGEGRRGLGGRTPPRRQVAQPPASTFSGFCGELPPMITAITPTGGRPDALALADRWMQAQTCQDFRWIVLDDCDPASPKPERADEIIRPGWRWQEGDNTQHASMLALLEQAGDKVIIVEDDDYYAPEYIELMADALTRHDLVGECNALYYHVGQRAWKEMRNEHHASLCSTAVKGSARQKLVEVCKQGHRMIDIVLWRSHPGKLFKSRFSVGIKGLPGRGGIGVGHRLRGGIADPALTKLTATIGKDAEVYKKYGYS